MEFVLSLLLLKLLTWMVALPLFPAYSEEPKYFGTPMHEIMQVGSELYLSRSVHGEIIVAYSSKGSELKPNDYITHADGIRVLTGSLSQFILSGEREVVVPIVDDADVKFGGQRFLGFVLLQSANPRKLQARRGEVLFDLQEGGPAPTLQLGNLVVGPGGVQTTDDPNFKPIPHGGGICITAKDCYNYTGSCHIGKCNCNGTSHTGSYCQLLKPELSTISMLVGGLNSEHQIKFNEQQAQLDASSHAIFTTTTKTETSIRIEEPVSITPVAMNHIHATVSATQHIIQDAVSQRESQQTTQKTIQETKSTHQTKEQTTQQSMQRENQNEVVHPATLSSPPIQNKATVDMDARSASSMEGVSSTKQSETASNDSQKGAGKKKKGKKKRKPNPNKSKLDAEPDPIVSESVTKQQQQQQQPDPQRVAAAAIQELYGANRPYPEPYDAGKLAHNLLHERQKKRFGREPFLYSIRFRNGPIGISFDNKAIDASIVEKVIKGQQAELSDVKEGDKLVAIDQYNVTGASAKATQRLMSTLAWPRVLVFESRVLGMDPKEKEQLLISRTYNLTVVYPPTLTSQFSGRFADWTVNLNPKTALSNPKYDILMSDGRQRKLVETGEFCPLYRIRTSRDQFGCQLEDKEFESGPDFDEIMSKSGFVNVDTEQRSQLFAMVLQEVFTKQLKLATEPRSLAVVKRGLCSFVEKARVLGLGGANVGLVMNTDDEVLDMLAGKEKTDDLHMPLALAKESDVNLIHLAAMTNDVWAILSESGSGMSPACTRLLHLVEDIVDRWPHSVPFLSSSQILASKPPDTTKLRGVTEEGGRLALSGENGWTFFDYHLAMFGPQEVPIGPIRLQMAMPAFGCDPNAYTVRIKNTVVAILRGGGCSFGIKVINAQKLGAKAVMIVNTDDMKTMRLMALPDEIPLIKIPCIMVSRRIQFYVEEQLRFYYLINQHIVSIQPTGVFGEYEKRNQLTLPVRLSAG